MKLTKISAFNLIILVGIFFNCSILCTFMPLIFFRISVLLVLLVIVVCKIKNLEILKIRKLIKNLSPSHS